MPQPMLLTDIYNMCLSIPAKILEIKGNKAIAVYPERSRGKVKKQEADSQLVDNIKAGDYVLISNGFIIKKIEPKEAQEIIKTIQGG